MLSNMEDKEKNSTGNVTLMAAKPLRSSMNKGSVPEANSNSVHTTTTTSVVSSSVKSDPLSVSVWVPRSPRIPSSSVSKITIGGGSKLLWKGRPIPTAQSISESKVKNKRVILNVGGERHEVLWESLSRYPITRLGRLKECNSHDGLLSLCDDYCLESNEYFFDRHPRSLSVILNLYRKDKMHLAEDLCVIDFSEDLEYWGIDEMYLDACCQMKFQQKKDQINEDMNKDAELLTYQKQDDFGKGMWAEYREYVWDLFEKSLTLPQKIVGVVSICVIILSIVTLSLSTVPEFQTLGCKGNVNASQCEAIIKEIGHETNPVDATAKNDDLEIVDHPFLDKLEICCIAWFTFEYILRLIAAPSKEKFFRGWLNNIDLVAIAPFYVSLFLVQFDTPGRVLQVMRVIRILRIFKLARHSVGLQSLGFTLRHSYKNLGVLLLFLTVGVVIFSTLAYFAEREDNKGFESIPHAFYWALITMTTVGYGDVTPSTVLGKIISMIAGVCGVIIIALPTPIIVNNFGLFFEEQKRKEKALKRQKALETLKDTERANANPNYLPTIINDQIGGGEGLSKSESKAVTPPQ